MSKEEKIHLHIGDDDEDDYQVGYGKPPRHSQFKRGQSGNPRGRKPRVAYEEDDLPFRRYMMEPAIARINGKKMHVRKFETVLFKLYQKAMEGDFRSIKLLIEQTGGFKEFREEHKRQMTEASRKMVDEILKMANTWEFGPDDKKTGGS